MSRRGSGAGVARAQRRGGRKLCAAAVRQMRREHRRYGIPFRDFAAEHGVNSSTISRAVNGQTWSHV